jgi:hypothetical protein
MRELFEALSIFDWITPSIALLEDVSEGGLLNLDAWTFYVPYDKAIRRGWSAPYIETLLAHHGIKTWGRLVHFGEYFFKVKLAQAEWAEYVLTQNGIPLQKKSLRAPRLKRQARQTSQPGRHAPARDTLSFRDDLDNLLSPFLD